MNTGEGGCVVLNRGGSEKLTAARGIEHVHFFGRVSESAGLAGVPKTPKRCKAGAFPPNRPFFLFFGGIGVDEVHRNDLNAELQDVGKAGNGPGAVFLIGTVRIRSVDALVKSSENFSGLESWHIEKAAPDFDGGETSGFEARDDAEIVAAAFESTPEIGISRCGGDDDGA